jgi:hypothetical protein
VRQDLGGDVEVVRIYQHNAKIWQIERNKRFDLFTGLRQKRHPSQRLRNSTGTNLTGCTSGVRNVITTSPRRWRRSSSDGERTSRVIAFGKARAVPDAVIAARFCNCLRITR